MTDKELQELAAKAAGYKVRWHAMEGGWADGYECWRHEDGTRFAPLEDDGDALRLALTLNIEIDQVGDAITPDKGDGNRITFIGPSEGGGAVDFAATRRAIVRAAADIGKQQK